MINGVLIPRKFEEEHISAVEQRCRDIMQYFSSPYPTQNQISHDEVNDLIRQRQLHTFITDDVRKKSKVEADERNNALLARGLELMLLMIIDKEATNPDLTMRTTLVESLNKIKNQLGAMRIAADGSYVAPSKTELDVLHRFF